MKFSIAARTKLMIALLGALLICRTASAQNEVLIDSLRKTLKQQPAAKQFDLLCAIGFEYRISFQDSTFLYCKQAYELGKKMKIAVGLAKPLNFIGLAFSNKGDYKHAIDFYYQSIEVSSQQNDSIQLAHAYNNLGRAFYDIGDLARAHENFILSKSIFERKNDRGGLAYVYRSLASVYKSQKNSSEALVMSTRALELRKQLHDNRTLASAYMELGLLYQSINNFSVSLEKLRLADSVAAQVNDRLTKAEIKLGIAENLFQLNQTDSAFQLATTVLDLVQTGKNYKLFARSSMLIARYHLQKKDFSKALPILNDIEADSSGFGLASLQRDAAFLLMGYYARNNDRLSLEKHTSRYNFLNEKLENTDLKRQVDQLKFSVEIERTEKENRLLKLKQEQNRILILKQKNENLFLLLLAIIIGIFAFITFIFYRKRKRDNFKLEIQNGEINRQREEIEKQNQNLFKANNELSEINHEKNMLMGIVAHDLKSPINRIYALARILEMEGGFTENQLNYLRLIKETTTSGANLIAGLLDVTALDEAHLPIKFSLLDLPNLIHSKVDVLTTNAKAKDITITVQNEVGKSIYSDSEYIGRILDNLISNAVKFSNKGSDVFVKLLLRESNLVISVKDHGPGFSDADKKNLYKKFKKLSARPTGGESSNGLGLAIVKTLVDRLKGTIELKSTEGSGSEFIVEIPIQ